MLKPPGARRVYPTMQPKAFRCGLNIHTISGTGALLFEEHGENMLCTKIVLNVRNNFCAQHAIPRFELGIFMC